MNFDKNRFTCQGEKEDKMAQGFQISHCYWSFLSDIMAVKWLNIFSPQLEDGEKSPSPLSAKEQSEMLASEDEMWVVAGDIDINDILQQITDDTLGSFMAALTRVSVHEEIIVLWRTFLFKLTRRISCDWLF